MDGTLETIQLNLEDVQDIRNLSRQDMPMILITHKNENTYAKEAKIFGFIVLNHPIDVNMLHDILGEHRT